MVKICSEDEAHSSEELTLVLENEDGESCTTRRLRMSDRQTLANFSPGQFGEQCSQFRVTATTKVWASNSGKDNLCLTHLILDTVNRENGIARSALCRFDQDELFKIFDEEINSIPLICS